jgi:hypothetical protein
MTNRKCTLACFSEDDQQFDMVLDYQVEVGSLETLLEALLSFSSFPARTGAETRQMELHRNI